MDERTEEEERNKRASALIAKIGRELDAVFEANGIEKHLLTFAFLHDGGCTGGARGADTLNMIEGATCSAVMGWSMRKLTTPMLEDAPVDLNAPVISKKVIGDRSVS